jgi:hypothetical protein
LLTYVVTVRNISSLVSSYLNFQCYRELQLRSMQLARHSNWSAVPERLSAARWCRLLLLLTRRQYVLARKQNLCARLYQGRGEQNVLHMFAAILVILHE